MRLLILPQSRWDCARRMSIVCDPFKLTWGVFPGQLFFSLAIPDFYANFA
jgi:hypothetical protein